MPKGPSTVVVATVLTATVVVAAVYYMNFKKGAKDETTDGKAK